MTLDPKHMSDKYQGIYKKFTVERTDGKSAPGEKHENCEYFVIDMTHDKYAPDAIKAYAEACQIEYPALAADLMCMSCDWKGKPWFEDDGDAISPCPLCSESYDLGRGWKPKSYK